MARAGVIFDLDGVLIDSEGLYYRAYSEVLQAYGVNDQPGGIRRLLDRHRDRAGVHRRQTRPCRFLPAELRQLRSPVYVKLLEQEGRLMPHVEQTLAALAPHFALTVATNSNRDALDLILQRFGIARFFPMTVARQDYTGAKPLPDAFVTAARKLGLAPDRCVVVEDTYKGVMAAGECRYRLHRRSQPVQPVATTSAGRLSYSQTWEH